MPQRSRSSSRNRVQRRGSTLVEFAMVAMPLFLFFFASVEFGRGMITVNTLEESARAGCRAAILRGATVNDIEETIDEMMSINGIDDYEYDYSPQPLSAADQWEPVTVTVRVNLGDVSFLPLPRSLSGIQYTASSTLPKESRPTPVD